MSMRRNLGLFMLEGQRHSVVSKVAVNEGLVYFSTLEGWCAKMSRDKIGAEGLVYLHHRPWR
jgi:hypothetical protein